MESENTYKLLTAVLNILKMMTEAGAEIYRVEESAKLIFKAYGFKNVDVYATTSNIIVSVEAEDNTIKTHTKMMDKISINIEKIHLLNNLIRDITAQKPPYQYIESEIEKIEQLKRYPVIANVLFYGVVSGAFYFFFGGRTFIEFLISILIGICTGIINFFFDKLNCNKIFAKFILSFVAAFAASVFNMAGIVFNVDYLIIANIMTLVPGIGFTNSLRDLFVGDNITGVLRLIEAGLSALAIACGYVAVSAVFGGAL